METKNIRLTSKNHSFDLIEYLKSKSNRCFKKKKKKEFHYGNTDWLVYIKCHEVDFLKKMILLKT